MTGGRSKQNKLNWKKSIRFHFEQEKKKLMKLLKFTYIFKARSNLQLSVHSCNKWALSQKYLHVFENFLTSNERNLHTAHTYHSKWWS